ncbi:hypothetical protein TWF696_004273 [Orbilia brochopaga]|uniref:C2H2-type domain-containing protein n=1 Tax=Orbilia brochopaga TaxID=3140254 RepID=A0AAV9V9H3_9PEZI
MAAQSRVICCTPCDYIFVGVFLLQEHHIDRHISIVCQQCEGEQFYGMAEFRGHAPCLGLHASKCGDCGMAFDRTLDRDGSKIIEHAKRCQAVADGLCRGLFFTSSKEYKEHCLHDSTHKQGLERIRHEREQRRLEKIERQQKRREDRRAERERKAREEAEKPKQPLEEDEPEPEWTGWEGWPLHAPPAPEPEAKAHFETQQLTNEQLMRQRYGIRSALEPDEEVVWPPHMISPWAAAAEERRQRGLARRAERKAKQQQELQAAEAKVEAETSA